MKSKKENIAEYILYLWQLEDYLRAFPDMASTNTELMEVYDMMLTEGVMAGGHIQMARNAMEELEDLHNELYDTEAPYHAVVLHLAPRLNLLKAKTNNPLMSDVEACLTLLYQVMMLRLTKQKISAETDEVVKDATQLLRFLSKTYYDDAQATI